MKKVIKYECCQCGDLFDSESICLKHEQRHKDIEKANEMLNDGATLQKINDICHVWYSVPEHLKNVTTNNCFTISYWQGCNKPAYKIDHIFMDGRVRVWGCGSWNGYYGNNIGIDSRNLRNVHNAEELFVDPRYAKRISEGW